MRLSWRNAAFWKKKIDSILHRQDFIAKSEKELEKARKVYEEDCMQLHGAARKKQGGWSS